MSRDSGFGIGDSSVLLDATLEHLRVLVSFDTRNPPRAIDTGGIFDYLRAQLPGFDVTVTDFGAGAVVGGSKVLAGSNIGGIPATQEMLEFAAAHGLGATIDTISADQVDAAYDRVVAGDVRYRFVIDTSTINPA